MRHSKRESPKTRDVCKDLEALGAMILPLVAGRFQAPGWPDRHVVHPAWAGWLEFKDWDTPVTTLQRIILRRLNERRPGYAYIVRFDEHDTTGFICDHDEICLCPFTSARELILGLIECSKRR